MSFPLMTPYVLPVAPALLALLADLAATSADFDLALEPPSVPVGVTATADLGRADREEEEEEESDDATAIVAISGHFRHREPFHPFEVSSASGYALHISLYLLSLLLLILPDSKT